MTATYYVVFRPLNHHFVLHDIMEKLFKKHDLGHIFKSYFL